MATLSRHGSRLAVSLIMLLAVWVLVVGAVFLVPTSISLSPPGVRRPPQVENPFPAALERYTTYLAAALQGRFYHPDAQTNVREELVTRGGPSLALIALSLLTSLLVGVGGTLLVRLARNPRLRSGWQVGMLMGMVIPESVLAGLLWLGAFGVIVTWGYKPFPVMWGLEANWRHYVLPVAFPAARSAKSCRRTSRLTAS